MNRGFGDNVGVETVAKIDRINVITVITQLLAKVLFLVPPAQPHFLIRFSRTQLRMMRKWAGEGEWKQGRTIPNHYT
jgi:hypothetical protein